MPKPKSTTTDFRVTHPEVYAAAFTSANANLLSATLPIGDRRWRWRVLTLLWSLSRDQVTSNADVKRALKVLNNLSAGAGPILTSEFVKSAAAHTLDALEPTPAHVSEVVEYRDAQSLVEGTLLELYVALGLGAEAEISSLESPIGTAPPTTATTAPDTLSRALLGTAFANILTEQRANRHYRSLTTSTAVRTALGIDFSEAGDVLLARLPSPERQVISQLLTADPSKIGADKPYTDTLVRTVVDFNNLRNERSEQVTSAAVETIHKFRQGQSTKEEVTRKRSEASDARDEAVAAAELAASLLRNILREEQAAQIVGGIASFLKKVFDAQELFANGGSALAFGNAMLGAAVGLAGLLGGGGSANAAILKSVQLLDKKLDAFRKEVNARLDLVQRLQLQTIALLDQALKQLRELRFDLEQDFKELMGQIERLWKYEQTADRDQQLTEFSRLTDLARVINEDRKQGHAIDRSLYQDTVVRLKTYAESVSREAPMCGLIGNSMSPRDVFDAVEGTGRVELLFGLVSNLAKTYGYSVAEPKCPNPLEWVRGTYAVLQMRALFPDIENAELDRFIVTHWETGTRLSATIAQVGSRAVLEEIAKAYRQAFSPILSAVAALAANMSTHYGDTLTFLPPPQFTLTDERVPSLLADFADLDGRWETKAAGTRLWGFCARVNDDPLAAAARLGLTSSRSLGTDYSSAWGVESWTENHRLTFRKGRKAGLPPGPDNDLPYHRGRLKGPIKDDSGAVGRVDTGWVAFAPQKSGGQFLMLVRDETAIWHADETRNFLAQLDTAVRGASFDSIYLGGATLRLFAAIAVWRLGMDPTLERTVLHSGGLLLGSPSYLLDYVNSLFVGLDPETLAYVSSLVPPEARPRVDATVARLNSEAAQAGRTPFYPWSVLELRLPVGAVLEAAVTGRLLSACESLIAAGLHVSPTRSTIVSVDRAVACVAGFGLARGLLRRSPKAKRTIEASMSREEVESLLAPSGGEEGTKAQGPNGRSSERRDVRTANGARQRRQVGPKNVRRVV